MLKIFEIDLCILETGRTCKGRLRHQAPPRNPEKFIRTCSRSFESVQAQRTRGMAREIVTTLSAQATDTTSRLQQSKAFSTGSNSTEMVGARITAGSEGRTISILPIESSTAPIAAKDFTSFKKLPPELRVMIWKRSARTKGTITITHYNRGPYSHAPLTVLHNARTVPTILRICKESRDVGLKLYKLYLNGILCFKPIYINYHQDAFSSPIPRILKLCMSWVKPVLAWVNSVT